MMAPQLWDLTGRILSDSNWICQYGAQLLECWCGLFGIHHIDTLYIVWKIQNLNFFCYYDWTRMETIVSSHPSIVVVSPISRKDSFKCYFDLFCLASLKAHSHQQGVTGLMLIKDILNVVRQCLEIMWEKCHGLWFKRSCWPLQHCSTSSKILIDHHCQINGIFSKMFWILSAAFVYYFQSAL